MDYEMQIHIHEHLKNVYGDATVNVSSDNESVVVVKL